MATFNIEPISRFSQAGAVIKRPTEITCFSYDSEHKLRHDDSSLKYYYTPLIGASLSDGFESFRKLDDEASDEHIDALLASLVQLETRNGGERTQADFVTWRGMMTKIMTAPYSKFDGYIRDECNMLSSIENVTKTLWRDSFANLIVRIKGTIYIEESKQYKLESRRNEEKHQSRPAGQPSMDLMSYWGYKFETLCMLPKTWDATPREYIEKRHEQVVSNYEQYCSVVRTGIGDLQLILGGEVDGVWDKKQMDASLRTNWVELKTSADIRSDHDVLKFERKLNKFWAQSFLLGVPKILVGFRTNDMQGKLLRVQEFETTKIPATVRNQGRKSWESNVCINFLTGFLSLLKETIRTDRMWKIRRQERSTVIEITQSSSGSFREILSEEFIAWRERSDNLDAEKQAVLDRINATEAEV